MRCELTRGTRLDRLPVFQDIRLPELISLLRAAGFDAQVADASFGADRERPSSVVVRGNYPFRNDLREAKDSSTFLTLVSSAVLNRAFPSSQIHALNKQIPVGAALITDDGNLALRFSLCLTGGTGHGAVRDRVDEWDSSLKMASTFQIPPLAAASGIM